MEITLFAANDSEFTLDVKVAVDGRYRPAKINADPDSCYEEEFPEVEVNDAARLLLKNGTWIAYDLNKLPQKLREKIDHDAFERVMDSRDDEPDYEPDPDYFEECDGP